MTSWFFRWLARKLSLSNANGVEVNKPLINNSPDLDGKCLRFELFFAEGGAVLQRRIYDSVKDRNETKLYMISEGDAVAEKVGEIISFEMLRGIQ